MRGRPAPRHPEHQDAPSVPEPDRAGLEPGHARVDAVANDVLETKDLAVNVLLRHAGEPAGHPARVLHSDEEVAARGVRERRHVGEELPLRLVAVPDLGLVVDPASLPHLIVHEALKMLGRELGKA